MPFTLEEIEALIEAVEYKRDVSAQNDPEYCARVWAPLLAKLSAIIKNDK